MREGGVCCDSIVLSRELDENTGVVAAEWRGDLRVGVEDSAAGYATSFSLGADVVTVEDDEVCTGLGGRMGGGLIKYPGLVFWF